MLSSLYNLKIENITPPPKKKTLTNLPNPHLLHLRSLAKKKQRPRDRKLKRVLEFKEVVSYKPWNSLSGTWSAKEQENDQDEEEAEKEEEEK